MDNAGKLVWDQSHMLQSGRYDGRMVILGKETIVEDYGWGQAITRGACPSTASADVAVARAASRHDSMLGVWHWELANGARVYTDGCWAPADGSDPIPVIDFRHELDWTDADGKPATWTGNWQDVVGLKGVCEVTLAGGRVITIENEGTCGVQYGARWAAPQGVDRRCAEAAGCHEVTGVDHHRYFPKKS